MSLGDIIRSVFELALIVVTIIAMINEQKIAVFERKFARACVIHLRNRRLRKQAAAAMAAASIQGRAPETVEEDFVQPKLTLIDCGHRVA